MKTFWKDTDNLFFLWALTLYIVLSTAQTHTHFEKMYSINVKWQ